MKGETIFTSRPGKMSARRTAPVEMGEHLISLLFSTQTTLVVLVFGSRMSFAADNLQDTFRRLSLYIQLT